MHTGEFIQQRPTHRKELSDEFFAADFIESGEQHKVDVDPDDQMKTRRPRKTSFLPAMQSSIVKDANPKQKALIISISLSIVFLFGVLLIYLFFINQVVTRRFIPRFRSYFAKDHHQPRNSCVFFSNEKVKTIFHESMYQNMMITETMINGLAGKDVIRIAILKNKIYVQESEMSQEKDALIDMLYDVTSNFVIPDVMFAVYTGKSIPTSQNIIFNIVDPSNHVAITVPNATAIHIWETQEKHKIDLLKQENPFDERKRIAVYRGTYSNPSKPLMESTVGALLRFSAKYPELVDAKLTECKTCSDAELLQLKTSGQLLDRKAPHESELAYKYQIILGPKVPLKKLYSNSLILSVESQIEKHTAHLTPFVQYVPIKEDLSDLPHKLRWVDEYHGRVMEILMRAEALGEVLLSKDCAEFYWRVLLEKYAKHQKINVEEVVSQEGWVSLSPYRIYS